MTSNDTDIYVCPNDIIKYTCTADFSPQIWEISGLEYDITFINNGRNPLLIVPYFYGKVITRTPFTTEIYVGYVDELSISEVICRSLGKNVSRKSIIYHRIYGK